jgi:hypothetical protein
MLRFQCLQPYLACQHVAQFVVLGILCRNAWSGLDVASPRFPPVMSGSECVFEFLQGKFEIICSGLQGSLLRGV